MGGPETSTCSKLPDLLSSFVNAFVDFSVSGGLFLPPNNPNYPNNNPNNPNNPNSNNPNPNIRSSPPFQTFLPSPARLIAVGDIHGDLAKFQKSLRLAGLLDSAGDWSGGDATLVQVGDVLDRGGEEIKALYFLEKLKRQAEKAGGRIVTMNGNHEIMNVYGDFRYITPESLKEFSDWAFWYRIGNSMKSLCSGLVDSIKDPFLGLPSEFKGIRKEFQEGFRARIAALRPNGPISTRFLADNVTVLVMGENVFVHGGLLPNHVEYGLERINEEVRDWINGVRSDLCRDIGRGRNSIVWLRRFSHEMAEKCDCKTLEHVLATIPGAKRMIMGHTIQEDGINGACEGKAIRIDVGMSRGCINGLPEVLEIDKDSGLRVLSLNPLQQENYASRIIRSRGKQGLGVLLEEDTRRKHVQVRA